MTLRTKAYLKGKFETGDKPTQEDYSDLIDSTVNKSDDLQILGLSEYDPIRSYAAGQGTFRQGKIYQALQNATGAFTALHWRDITKQVLSTGFPLWDNLTVWGLGVYVERNVRLFKSLQAGNVGQDPLTAIAWWTEISTNNGTFGNYWQPGLYGYQHVVRWFDVSKGELGLMECTVPTGFISDDISSELQEGKWRDVGGAGGADIDDVTPFASKVYSSRRVEQLIANLVNSAPETLNTLNELAAALGNDSNFATTVSNQIAGKVSKAGDTISGDLVFGNNVRLSSPSGNTLKIGNGGSATSIEGSVGLPGSIYTNIFFLDAGPRGIYFPSGPGDNKGIYSQGDYTELFYHRGPTGSRHYLRIKENESESVLPGVYIGSTAPNFIGLRGTAYYPPTNNFDYVQKQYVDGLAGASMQHVFATNSGTTTINDNVSTVILNPAADIASHTFNMPANPTDGQILRVAAGANTITTLTHSGNGKTLVGALVTLTGASGGGEWIYRAASTTWFRIK